MVARSWGEKETRRYYLMGIEVQFEKWKKVLEVNGVMAV